MSANILHWKHYTFKNVGSYPEKELECCGERVGGKGIYPLQVLFCAKLLRLTQTSFKGS